MKTIMRLLRDNTGAFGTVHTARFSRALLTLRNTLDRETKKSPAQVLFGRPIQDFLLSLKRKLMGELWETLADQRALALVRRGTKMSESWEHKTRFWHY